MIEIIPNWHPLFVHFTVALLFTSVILFVVAQLMPDNKYREQCQCVALWNLWLGAGITVFTVLAGVIAYNSVAHDTPSHEAMTEHRNWALATAALFVVLAIWFWKRVHAGLGINKAMLIVLVFGAGLLASTAWHGGEVVYRYGLGVMSLPKVDAHGHADGHVSGHVNGEEHHHDLEKNGGSDLTNDHHSDAVHDNTDSHPEAPIHDNSDGHHDTDHVH